MNNLYIGDLISFKHNGDNHFSLYRHLVFIGKNNRIQFCKCENNTLKFESNYKQFYRKI
jgi:hypothetical protein